ncbi:MAG: DUF1501 domain-containing protein [Myxococcota bacterium]
MKRRTMVRTGALALGGALLPAPGRAQDAPVLVSLFLRGAMDTLGVIAPHADRNYRRLRPQLGVPAPASNDLDLGEGFALHPAFQPLMAHRAHLAFVLATGLPVANRSHFAAQYVMEHGGESSVNTEEEGWLTRLVRSLGADDADLGAVAIGSALPDSLAGSRALAARPGRAEAAEPSVRALYDGTSTGQSLTARIRRQGQGALRLQERLRQLAALDRDSREAFGRGGLARDLQLASRLISSTGVRVLALSHGGWDTHRGQARTLQARGRELSQALTAFWSSLGDHRRRVAVVVQSEFGRTAAVNGTGGTDHGYGSSMWVLGDGVRGGVHGDWPGLSERALFEGRDLRVTTDYRAVLQAVATSHLRAPIEGFPSAELGIL